MSGPEATLERKHRARAIKAGWFVEKLTGFRKGWPDRFYARGGRIVLVEWKSPYGGKLSPSQEERIRQLRAAGVEVHVLDSLEEAERVFR